MPIEREFKYVLKDADMLYWALLGNSNVTGIAGIDQGYLSRGGRIRRRSWWTRNGDTFLDSPSISHVEHIFTYKHDLTFQPGCLEIETEISKEDYELGWIDATHKIVKTRVLLPSDIGAGVWEIDFFTDTQGFYLALAEFEVPANAGPPDRLHPLVAQFLHYRVNEDDGRFKNRKLCQRELVEKLLLEIAQ